MKKTVFITGATSGFGEACAYLYAEKNYNLILNGRRAERLEKIKSKILSNNKNIDIILLPFDVQKKDEVEKSINSLQQQCNSVDVLVNNAGLAIGTTGIQDGLIEDWETMIDTNIKGVLYVTKFTLPLLLKSSCPHIVNVGSIAGKVVYKGGNVYCATKHAVDALSQAMRIDYLDLGIKVSQVLPGAAETEFSIVRYKGDKAKAANVYEGYKPLVAEDVANIIVWVTELPQHVNINELLVMPTAQAAPGIFKKN